MVRMVCALRREWSEALRLDWGRSWSAGKLIPETEYYDLRCETVDGNEWRAQRALLTLRAPGEAARIVLELVHGTGKLSGRRPDMPTPRCRT